MSYNAGLTFIISMFIISAYTQEIKRDSLKILPKVHHAEPLYVDLVRDLGARKGEKEWNVGYSTTNSYQYNRQNAFIEYEFAPFNRWGFEVEIPLELDIPHRYFRERDLTLHKELKEAIKLASQYTFFVSTKIQTSMAVGYIHEFILEKWDMEYSPFLVVAKRWGKYFHSLIYTGPIWRQSTINRGLEIQMNANIHYIIPNSLNFIGLETAVNIVEKMKTDIIFRPQMRVQLSENVHLGCVVGIPLLRSDNNRLEAMVRLIILPENSK